MGIQNVRDEFDETDYARFGRACATASRRCGRCSRAPASARGRRRSGRSSRSTWSTRRAGRSRSTPAVLADTLNPRVTLGIDRFKCRDQHAPRRAGGEAVHRARAAYAEAIGEVSRAATAHGGRVALVGILPTLTEADLAPAVLTEGHRYRAISNGLRRLRQRPFAIRDRGRGLAPLRRGRHHARGGEHVLPASPARRARGVRAHLQRRAARDGARAGRRGQLAHVPRAPASWDETRIPRSSAIQSVDDRPDAAIDQLAPGAGVVRPRLGARGRARAVRRARRHARAAAPGARRRDPLAQVETGRVPALSELRLHNGTVWRWNRPVFDDAAEGTCGSRCRAPPAGPTVIDALASSAFLLGVALGLAEDADALSTGSPSGRRGATSTRPPVEASTPSSSGLEARPRRRAPSPRRRS